MDEDQFQTMRLRADRLQTGEIVAGKYRIQSVLGEGGMGTVYRVTNIFFDLEFALKVLDRRCAPNAVLVKRFQNEAKAAFSLNHTNLVKVHDFGILEGGDPYLVMDLVSGETLADLIKRQTVIPYEEYLPILEQICAGLSYAHSNSVIHRDVKPANIMISRAPQLSVKILDFGIAKIVNEEAGQVQELTRTGEIFGSPLYMSPEQCSGGVIDHRTDIYSLGCVSYEALTGAPPHVGMNALRTMMLHQTTDVVPLSEASLGIKFSPECERVVAAMLAKEPSQRFSDARQIAAELNPSSRDQFYVPQKRSAPLPKSKQASAISFSKFQLAGLVCGVVAVTALVTYLVAQNLSPKQVVYQPSAKLQAPVDAKPVIAAASAEDTKKTAAPSPSQFDSVEKITSRVVKNDKGGLDRIIYFPPFEIGEVFVVDEHFERFGNMELAKGKVVIPSDDRLRFTVVRSLNQETILHPQIIKKIEPTLFSDLGISNNDSGFNLEAVTAAGKKVETFDAGLDAPTLSEDEAAREKQDVKRLSLGALQSSPEALEEGQKQILINAQSWVNLRAVTFEFATITDGMVDALLGLKKLQCLRLIDTETVSPKLEVSPVLTTLKIMEFRNYDPKFLWAKPESYRELMDLSIDCQMTPQALASLKKLPQLRRLRMRQHSYVAPPSLINWIASSKLAWVTFDEAHISPQDVKRILANPNIERLRVNSKLKPTLDSLGLIDPHRLSYVSGSVID